MDILAPAHTPKQYYIKKSRPEREGFNMGSKWFSSSKNRVVNGGPR
jgi:hypothetical protein